MAAGLTYATWGALIEKLLAINPPGVLTTTNVTLLNSCCDYAELRILRELDFLSTQSEVDSPAASPGTRTLAVPGSILIMNEMQAITPANTAFTSGSLNPMQRVAMPFINAFWPSQTVQALPSYWSMSNDSTIVLAPTPDQAYRFHCTGVIRPQALYQVTPGTTTFISLNLPDLFVAASMIWGSGFIKGDLGMAADDPKAAISYESIYQGLKEGVQIETLRQKAWLQSWTPYSPSPGAEQSRTG